MEEGAGSLQEPELMGGLQGDSAFWKEQDWCVNELTGTVAACTCPPAQIHARQGPCTEKGKWTQSPN